MQDFLSSNKDVTLAARRGLLLKFKSVARRRLPKAGVTAEERSQQLEAEMQVFATAANAGDLATDFNSSFRSVAPSTLNQTARSVYYQTSASRSMYQEEEGEEIVIDASPPRMAVTRSPPMVNSLPQAVSPPSPSPRYSPLQQPPITPLPNSWRQQSLWHRTLSLAAHLPRSLMWATFLTPTTTMRGLSRLHQTTILWVVSRFAGLLPPQTRTLHRSTIALHLPRPQGSPQPQTPAWKRNQILTPTPWRTLPPLLRSSSSL